MRVLSTAEPAKARKIDRPLGRETDQMVGDVLAEIAGTLWPTNTAAALASHCGCSVRAAERYLSGDRDWSGDAIAAIVSEILKRHGMRNARVKAK